MAYRVASAVLQKQFLKKRGAQSGDPERSGAPSNLSSTSAAHHPNRLVDTSLWQLSALRGEQKSIIELEGSHPSKQVKVSVQDDAPEALQGFVGNLLQCLVTNGDGACGIHAGIGWPTLRAQRWQPRAKDARAWIRKHLGKPFRSVEQSVQTVKDSWERGVVTSLWSEFAEPVMLKERGLLPHCELTTEHNIFWRHLQKPEYAELR